MHPDDTTFITRTILLLAAGVATALALLGDVATGVVAALVIGFAGLAVPRVFRAQHSKDRLGETSSRASARHIILLGAAAITAGLVLLLLAERFA